MFKIYNENNVFYKILTNQMPCKKILENANALAFHDAYPKAPIHALVIPRGKYIDMQSFYSQASQLEILDFIKAVSDTITKLNITDGFRAISNSGINGGQDVPHYHLHILAGIKLAKMIGED